MNITAERHPDCRVTANIEVPAERVEAERAHITRGVQAQAKVPGFRPGKVPERVIAKRFKDHIDGELKDRLMREGVREAAQKEREEKRSVLEVTKVNEPTFHLDGSFTFEVEFALAPEIELPDYTGIKVRVPKVQISEKNIEDALANLQDRLTHGHPIEDPEAELELGNAATVSFEAFVDGQLVSEAHPEAPDGIKAAEKVQILVQTGSFIPGFAEGLVGAKAGEERTVTVTVPEDFPYEPLRNAAVDFAVAVHDLIRVHKPDLDDDFAKKYFELPTLEELRERVKEDLERGAARRVEEIKANQIKAHLVENTNFEVPQTYLDREAQRQADNEVRRALQQGVGEDIIMEHQQQILQNAQGRAQGEVRVSFLLSEIAKKEDLTVSDREVSERAAAYAAQSQVPVKKFAKQLSENGGFDQIRGILLHEKALAFLGEKAEVEEFEPSEEEQDQVVEGALAAAEAGEEEHAHEHGEHCDHDHGHSSEGESK
ncbi:MAG: trigger factor [Verrucomicrobiales bacterium]